MNLDLKYQANALIAQSYVTYVAAQYQSLASQANFIEFIANDSANFLTQALAREPGDIITAIEPVTGISIDVVIQSVSFEVTEGPWIRCRFGVAPAAPFQSWVAGIVGRSEAGTTTVPGF